MQSHALQAAADLLRACRNEGRLLSSLPRECRPESREQGYAVQALSVPEPGDELFGWKIAATSVAGQVHIGVDGPLAGRLMRSRVRHSGDCLSLASNLMRVAECEMAFRMAMDLPPRDRPYSRDEVTAAIDALMPAIEVPDSRYEHFEKAGAPQLIADNACAREFVLGAATGVDWRSMDLAGHAVVAHVVDDEGKLLSEHTGSGANVLGHPLVALTWIANELSGLGIGLRAGEVVTTGTCLAPVPVNGGEEVRADFGVLGQVVVRFR